MSLQSASSLQTYICKKTWESVINLLSFLLFQVNELITGRPAECFAMSSVCKQQHEGVCLSLSLLQGAALPQLQGLLMSPLLQDCIIGRPFRGRVCSASSGIDDLPHKTHSQGLFPFKWAKCNARAINEELVEIKLQWVAASSHLL